MFLPTSTRLQPPTNSMVLAWGFQLLSCCVTFDRALYLSGPQTWPSKGLGRPEDTAGKQMTPSPSLGGYEVSWTDLGSNLHTHPKPRNQTLEGSVDISAF